MSILATIAAGNTLDAAFEWLCKRRKNYPASADVWHFRRSWPEQKRRIQFDLMAGDYRFGLLSKVELANGDAVDLWSSRDAVVLKAMTMALQPFLPVLRSCVHVKGHGGAKAAVRRVARNLAANHFVMRTDVKSFYASIDHHLLMDRLAVHIKDKAVLNLVGQYLRRTVESGGQFFDYERGISLGCPLSPLIGAFFLSELDLKFERLGLFYVRFMDDILILAPTRWKLRHAVKAVNQQLSALDLEKHPDKTFIGRIEKGFDFLGFHFTPSGVTVAETTVVKFVERAIRLYEQDREEPLSPSRLDLYVRRWHGWATAVRSTGLESVRCCLPNWPNKWIRILTPEVDSKLEVKRRILVTNKVAYSRRVPIHPIIGECSNPLIFSSGEFRTSGRRRLSSFYNLKTPSALPQDI